MKREQLERAKAIEEKLKGIKDSEAYKICDLVLEFNSKAPYRFGVGSTFVKDKWQNYLCERKADYPFITNEDKAEIQDEYIRFIERVDRKIKKIIDALEKELEAL